MAEIPIGQLDTSRYDKLARVLPKNKFKLAPSAVEAGFSPQYAYKQGKIIRENLIKRELKKIEKMNGIEISDKTNKEIVENKQTLASIIGMSSGEVFERLKYIANQDKDLTSALKVLKPISKDLGVDLTENEAPSISVPVLNIGIKEKTPQIAPIEVVENGSTEP